MDLERRVAYGLMNLPANTKSQDRVDLTEFRMTPTNDGWLVMVKGNRRGKNLIGFYHAATWAEALRTCTTSIDSRHAVWRVEEPPPWLR